MSLIDCFLLKLTNCLVTLPYMRESLSDLLPSPFPEARASRGRPDVIWGNVFERHQFASAHEASLKLGRRVK